MLYPKGFGYSYKVFLIRTLTKNDQVTKEHCSDELKCGSPISFTNAVNEILGRYETYLLTNGILLTQAV